MSCVAVVGAQWGDEGKGKIVDVFTESADLVVRYAGGANAGHTLVVDGEKIVVRLLPSGILRSGTRCVLAQGMVVDLEVLFHELDALEAKGKLGVIERVALSERAHLILPYHKLVDELREAQAPSNTAIGTTKKGIGPAYEDKARRTGVRLVDLAHPQRLRSRIEMALAAWAPSIASLGGELPNVQGMLRELEPLVKRTLPLLTDTSKLVDVAIRAGKNVLLEGAQGTLLDVDHGTYPFVTSSSPVAGGATTGIGMGPTRISSVIGIVKAYATRVGGGPFPTELTDKDGAYLQEAGAEFGSVTGRRRRTGWLDLPALRYAARVNGLTGLAITKLDVLTSLNPIKACVAYQSVRGRQDDFPIDSLGEAGLTPIYQEFEGWSENLGHARSLTDLPPAARRYLEFIEQAAEVPLQLVSVGPGRHETIVVREAF